MLETDGNVEDCCMRVLIAPSRWAKIATALLYLHVICVCILQYGRIKWTKFHFHRSSAVGDNNSNNGESKQYTSPLLCAPRRYVDPYIMRTMDDIIVSYCRRYNRQLRIFTV